MRDGELCGVDLARKTNTWAGDRFRYRANIDGAPVSVEVREGGGVCLPLAKRDYSVVTIANGIAKDPIRVHVAGERIVGIER